MVDRHGVHCVLVRQDDARFRTFESCSAHVGLVHAVGALEVLDQVLVLRVVQQHLDLVVGGDVLQDDGVAFSTAVVLVEELLDKGLQSVQLDLSRDDNVRDLRVDLVDSPLIERLETHQVSELHELTSEQVEDHIRDQHREENLSGMLLRSDIAIPHGRDSDYSGIEGSEVFELIQKVEVLEYHKDSRREVDRDEEIRQDGLQLGGDFTLTGVDEDCE